MTSNLEYYRAFFYVANTESFTQAAAKLHVTQSAVSQSVKKLEEALSCALFIRQAKKVYLTPEGKELYKKVQIAFSNLQRGEEIVSDMRKHKNNELHIGATETSIYFYLPQYIKKWKRDHPDLRLVLLGSTTGDLCRLLANEEITEAFLISPLPEEAYLSFDMVKIGEIQDIPVVSKNFFETEFQDAKHDCLTLKQLSLYPLISVSEDNSVRTMFQKWFLSEDLIFSPQYTVTHIGLVLSLIEQDLGVGFVPFPFAKPKLDSGVLRQINLTSLPAPRSVYLARKIPSQESESFFIPLAPDHPETR